MHFILIFSQYIYFKCDNIIPISNLNKLRNQNQRIFQMKRKLLFYFIIILNAVPAFAQVPANDLCMDAITVNCGDVVMGNTVMATNTDDPLDGCGTTDGAPGVWYSFAGTGDLVQLALCNSNYDTKLRVYSGNCNGIVCVDGNDDSCGLQSEVSFISDAATNYLIYVFGFGTSTGDYELSITCLPPPPPVTNDTCDMATPIVCGDSITNTTIGATSNDVPPTCGGVFDFIDTSGVWYSFSGTGDIITFSTCVADFDTQIQVFSGNCFGLVCIGGNNDDFDSCGNNGSQFSFESDASTEYLIYVNSTGFQNGEGVFTLDVLCTPPPPPPANDECDMALVASVNADDTCAIITSGTLFGATASNVMNPCTGTANDDVWFEFTATATAQIISIDNIVGNDLNLIHSVYQNDCDNLINLFCSTDNESLISNLIVGDVYYIRVYSFGDANPFINTTFDLCIRQLPPAPANDECDMAFVASVNADDTCTIVNTGLTLEGATDSNIMNSCSGIADDDVWVSFVALSEVQIIELSNIMGDPNDLDFGVYEGACDSLTNIACSAGESISASDLTIGDTYFIRIYTAGSDPVNNTTFDLCIRNGLTAIVCADGAMTGTFCYDDNSTVQNIFQGDTAFPLRLTFTAGEIEAFADQLIVLDSDGVTNLNMDPGVVDLTDLVFTASGNSISFSVQSDFSMSCATTGFQPIEYEVICLECTEPEVTYNVVGTCEPETEFFVEVTVVDLGSGTSLNLTDNIGNPAQTANAPGTFTFGPYEPNIDMVVITSDIGDGNCLVTSEAFTFGCVVDGCYDILDAGEDVFISCEEECIELTATIIVEPNIDTSEYIIDGPICDVPPIEGGTPTNLEIDDTWSGVIDLPFTFNYYTNDYTQLVIGPNGQISFDVTLAGGFNGWNSAPEDLLPVNDGNFPFNTIYGAYHDLQPASNPRPDAINYYITGTAPYRVFVLNFNEIPHFGCEDTLTTSQQILLYESLNMIDVNLINKPVCATWNDGLATLGLMGNDLTQFSVPVDRNTGDWEASNESWRFIPAGDQNTQSNFVWQDPAGNVISDELTITVCPDTNTIYTAILTVENEDGTFSEITEEVLVSVEAGCIPFACVDNLLIEDFGTGTGRESDPFVTYTFNGVDQIDGAEYCLTDDSTGLNFGWHQGMEDHTPGDTNGRALYVNGSDVVAEAEFYRRPVTVATNVNYFFEFWMTTVYDIDTNICPNEGVPSNVIYRIEDTAGNLIMEGATGNIPNASEPDWQRFALEFNSGTNTEIQIALINNEFGVCGNDFAIDDMVILSEGETPATATPSDIIICEDGTNTPFNLTDRTDEVLNGLNPANFTINFFTSENDAIMSINAIADPTIYIETNNTETIWIRVERATQPACFSIEPLIIRREPTMVLGPDEVFCDGEAFEIVPIITGDATGISYLWSTGATTPTITVNETGEYTLEINGGICSVDTIMVSFLENPDVNLGADFKTCPDSPVIITATASNVEGSEVTYQWFDDNGTEILGETNSTLEVTIPAGTLGALTYSVVIMNGICSDTDEIEISLYNVNNCVISQGVSPNGDGINDTLDLEFLRDRSGIANFQIFNRLGRAIYSNTNYLNEWGGQTDDGDLLPTGTYFYVIDFDQEDPVYGSQASGWVYLNLEK